MTQRKLPYNRDYDNYLNSDVWKCDRSPTGAHEWHGSTTELTCVHCNEIEILPVITYSKGRVVKE